VSVKNEIYLDTTQIIYQSFTQLYEKDNNETAKYKISGVFSYTNSAKGCADGIYQIDTLSPLEKSQNGDFSSGTLNINGATFRFNKSETADVTFQNGNTVYGVSALESTCE
jgi:hypothetical protein